MAVIYRLVGSGFGQAGQSISEAPEAVSHVVQFIGSPLVQVGQIASIAIPQLATQAIPDALMNKSGVFGCSTASYLRKSKDGLKLSNLRILVFVKYV